MRQGIAPFITRLLAILGILVLLGLFLKLMTLLLTPVLPAGLLRILSDGWNMLFDLVGAAWAPIGALAILGAVVFVIVGRRR